MPVPAAFICHWVLQDPILGPPALCTCELVSHCLFGIISYCATSFPILLSCRNEVQRVLKALHWAEIFSPCGAKDWISCHRCQSTAVFGHGSVGMPRDTGHRHLEESSALAGLAGTDPDVVLCVP